MRINPFLHNEDAKSKTAVVKKVVSFLITKHNSRPNKIIDHLQYLGYKDCIGLAVDISSSILKASPNYKNTYKLRADASRLPLRSKSFDILLMLDLLEHSRKPIQVLKEALRVSSHVIIKAPLELSLYTLLRGGPSRLKELEKKYGHVNHFNYRCLKEITKDSLILWESYSKIPNRKFLFDFLQSILLRFKLYGLFRVTFGGFAVLALTEKVKSKH